MNRTLIFTYSQRDLTKAMEEVKRPFKKHQYKNCSALCIQLLQKTKDPTREHPLFMTWMSFYAAAALEETSRGLNINSSDKIPILEQALSYYEKAKSYLELVPDMDPTVTQITQQRSSSVSSSIYAPTESICSLTETPSSSSPTLPSPAASSPGNGKGEGSNFMKPSSDQTLRTSPTLKSPVVPPHFLCRPANRFCIHLQGMNVQLDYHINFANEKLAVLRKVRCSNQLNWCSAYSASGIDGIDMEEMRRTVLKARAERLREEGWKRERFDAEKYQMLCDKALAELD